MRNLLIGTALFSALGCTSASAADKPLIGAVPAWVTPAPELSPKDMPRSANILPQFDEQVWIDGDTVTIYVDVATYISSPEALNKAGTVSMAWQPAHGDITFHRIEVIRGDQRIDMLKSGSDFTVIQREAGLERSVVDGRLTAVKHLEGLRVGDIVRTTLSVSQRDDVLKGNVQDGMFLLPSPLRIGFGRARLVWPRTREINWKSLVPGITATPHPIAGNRNELIVDMPVAKLPEMPKNYPSRFEPLPLIAFSSFRSWGEVAAVMAPLYKTEGTIAPGSDLAKAVDAIAARSPDPIQRMAAALQLVQDDVRYVLLAMGNGNYVPQAPSDTWAKRFGDCKAKTLLLLAILDRLGISAEPVLANIKRGDAVGLMPPSAMAFDHVFVRARVGDESFWLDGTSIGSRVEDIRDVPRFGTVLPLFAKAPDLLKLPERANARPAIDIDLNYDLTAGPHLPAPYALKIRYAGRTAEESKVDQGGDYDDRLQKFAEKAAKNWTGSEEIGRTHAEYDAAKAVWTLDVEGVAYPEWEYRDNHYELTLSPTLKVVFEADRGRASWQKIPAVIDKPWTAHSRVTIRLPDAGKAVDVAGAEPSTLALPAVQWDRAITRSGNELIEDISARENGREIPAEEISASAKAINDAMTRTVRVALPSSYPLRWDDLPRVQSSAAVKRVRAVFDQRVADKPDDAARFSDRAWLSGRLLDLTAAEADYTKAIALDGSAARYMDRANNRAARGDHPGALKDAQMAFDLESGNADARDLLAQELTEAGRIDEALDLLATDPDLATDAGMSAFSRRISVLEIGKRRDDALRLLDQALIKQPSSATLRNLRCWFRALGNTDLDGALADCNRAIELASDPATFFDSRAMVHYRSGRLNEAKADLEAALAVSPEQSFTRFMRGIVLNKLGQRAEGAADLAAAKRIYPDVARFFEHFDIRP